MITDANLAQTELDARRAALPQPPARSRRGYDRLYDEHVLQADEGVDFDFC